MLIKGAAGLIIFYGLAHTIGALTLEGAASHAGAWFSGQLWTEDFSNMSPAGSALWFSLDSFGFPLVLIGLLIFWLDRRGITPPRFLAYALGAWTVMDAIILLFTPWPIMLVAVGLLIRGIARADHRHKQAASA